MAGRSLTVMAACSGLLYILNIRLEVSWVSEKRPRCSETETVSNRKQDQSVKMLALEKVGADVYPFLVTLFEYHQLKCLKGTADLRHGY